MSKKRKSDSTGLDEVNRTMYSSFCNTANSLSQLYAQAQNQQKLDFQAGERHALGKLHQWIVRLCEEGSRVTVADIVEYLQNELNHGGEDASMSPAPQPVTSNAQMLFSTLSIQIPQGALGPATCGQCPTGISDQNKNSVFVNALSSPVRRSLQPFHLGQEGDYGGNGLQGRKAGYTAYPDNQVFHSMDGSQSGQSMDMHTGGSPHEYYR
ncbi:uncharacterized protein LOC143887584 isoform X2 [Tasmannia lanceolata]